MIWTFLILSFFPNVTWGGENKILPRISYLEDRIEKNVDWPTELTLVAPEDSSNGPLITLKIRIPPLLHLRGKDTHYSVKKTSGSQILEVNVNHPISVIRLEKIIGNPETVQPISLRISFPENSGFVKLSKECLRRFRNPGPLRSKKPTPLITYMYCPSLDKIVFKSTPEVEFIDGKKQLHFSSFEQRVPDSEIKDQLVIKRSLVKENAAGEFKVVLTSAGDVLERFERPEGESQKMLYSTNLSPAPPPERFQYFAGFNLSSKDPEIYGGIDFRKEDWRTYLTTAGMLSVPVAFRGHSFRHFVDGGLALTLNHPLTVPSAQPRAVLGAGLVAARRAAVEFTDNDLIWGPTVQLSLLKIHQFSHNSYLGLLLSGSFLTSDPLSEGKYDQIYQLETRWSLVLPHGQFVEPHLKVQHFNFEEKRTFDVTLLKVGMGVRW